MESSVVYTRGRIEADVLTRALISAAAAGLRSNCSDPGTGELWLSENEGERRKAARLCGGCPVFDPCGQVGQFQTFGVWAAVDKTKTKKAAA